MQLKLGDLVLRKDESPHLLFQITEFDGEYVILQGMEFPIITIASKKDLIKINRRRMNNTCLKRVK